MARKTQSRVARLKNILPAGYNVETYSPGDGVTRFRFFDNMTDEYFGPGSGLFTALGLKEAEAFARGLAARNCGRK